MRGLAGATFIALILAGCVTPTPALQGATQAGPVPQDTALAIDTSYVLDAPLLTVDFRNASIPDWMSVTVRNADNDTWFIAQRDDFRIRDNDGFVYGHWSQGYYYAPEPFPTSVRLEAREAIRGTLVFNVNGGTAPYTLVYDWPDGRIEVLLELT